jgi:hypothetical protein
MIASPDQQLDRILNALRDTPPPTGLAARVNAHLLQAAESPTRSTLFVSPWQITWAGAACAVVLLALLATHHQPARSGETQVAQGSVARGFSLGSLGSLVARPATTQVAPRFSAGSHTAPLKDEGALAPDPDAIALAETLAPSHPAPPLPLTAQEALLLRSTRQGQPIEVAELETRRTSVLTQIAEARERATVRDYIHGLLGPLATAQTLTPPPSPSDDTKPAADSEAPPSQ